MSGVPYGKFFWNDWQGDPLLRLCDLRSEAVWMRMLCLAAESKREGYVMVADRAATAEDIAKISGKPLAQIEAAIADLEKNGVFSRDRVGTIYSRRMVKDAKKRRASAKGGKIGGKSTHGKSKGIFATQAPTQHPESRDQSPETKEEVVSRAAPGGASHTPKPVAKWSPGFVAFIEAYKPVKTASLAKAWTAWTAITDRPNDDAMIAAATAYLADKLEESKGQKHPARKKYPDTWLHDRGFDPYLIDAARGDRAKETRARDLGVTLAEWNGNGEKIIAIIGKDKFAKLFGGSRPVITDDLAVIEMPSTWRSSQIGIGETDVLERVFKRPIKIALRVAPT